MDETTDLVLLHARVEQRDLGAASDLALEAARLHHQWLRCERRDRARGRDRLARDVLALRAMRRHLQDRAAKRALRAKATNEGPRVDADETRDAVGAQICREIDGPLAARVDELADDETLDPRTPALRGALEGSVIPDERIRQHDDLAVVGRVRCDLLVAGHRRVEHDLAGRRRSVAERLTPPRRAVFQPEDRRPGHRCITIRFRCIKMQLPFQLSDGRPLPHFPPAFHQASFRPRARHARRGR